MDQHTFGGKTNRLRAASDEFNKNIMRYLENVEYRRVTGGEDLEAIFRLRYKSYLKTDMIPPNPTKMLPDRWDGLPNTYLFGVHVDGDLVSTIRLTHLTAEQPESVTMEAFGDILRPRLAKGDTFVDVSRFASDTEKTIFSGAMPYITLRLAVLCAAHFEDTTVLCAIKPEHQVFYRRVFNFSSVGEPKMYPNLSVPRILHEAPRDNASAIARYPFFRSTSAERRLLFGDACKNSEMPLSIIPTARFVKEAA